MDGVAQFGHVLSPGGLLLLMVKASLVVAVVHYLVRQYDRSAAGVRHRLWIALLTILALLPVWSYLAPDVRVPLPPHMRVQEPGASPLVSTLLLIYVAVVAARSLHLALGVLRIGWITLCAAPAAEPWTQALAALSPARRVILRETPHIDSPLTWGYLSPVILVPTDFSARASERRMILLHELRHIERADWLSHLLGQWAGILFWPVPGVRAALANLSLEAERACDDFVLQKEGCAADYAALLLRQSQARRLPATVALGESTELVERIRSICQSAIDHDTFLPGRHWLIPLCVLIALPLACIRFVESLPPREPAPVALELSLGKIWPGTAAMSALDIRRPIPPAEVIRPPSGGTEDPLIDMQVPQSPVWPEGVFEDSVRQAMQPAVTTDPDYADVIIHDLESVFRFRLQDARASPH